MKLAKRNTSLFPHSLTTSWNYSYGDEFDDYLQFLPCPWSTNPKTLDEFLQVCDQRQQWIAEHNAEPPTYWSCRLTHSLMEDMVRTIKELKDDKRNT